MNTEKTAPGKPIRLWPGVIAVVLQWLVMIGVPMVAPDQGGTAIVGGVVFGLVVVLWWLFFSRAPWMERIGAIGLMVITMAGTLRLVHASIANGMMGFMPFLYAVPVLSLALIVWAAATRGQTTGRRRASMVAAILIACGTLTLVRTDGISGDAASDFAWRWTPTAEERLLAQEPVAVASPPAAEKVASEVASPAPPVPAAMPERPVAAPGHAEPAASATVPAAAKMDPAAVTGTTPRPSDREPAGVEWAGFRGANRDGVVRGANIETDWVKSPPIELWRRPIGPGWSSFAVAGDRVFTQEQRGDDEIVSAYSLKTGEPVWRHRDPARFWESNAGAGPRATPTLSNGRVYTLGGTGILNALDAHDGSVVWSRNAAADTGRTIPDWGISSSPLVVGDVVVAATAGTLAAYDAVSGAPRWVGQKGGWGYSSPQLWTNDGVAQIVLLNGPGAIGVAPSDGKVLWKYEWAGDSIVQPALLADGSLLVGSGSGLAAKTGMLRVSVKHGALDGAEAAGGWNVTERWTSTGLKPYFNDFVVHQGHAFGFDGSILACLDLEDGKRKWKGGRYGHGQLVLLPEQNLLLVLSEEGELALVSAASDKFTELARFKAIEGKTWNHPVLVGDVLLVRNGEEMAAFRLARLGR